MKWIEINVEKPPSATMDSCLSELVRPVLDEFNTKIKSWHFLWEGRPWPTTLRLRFLGDDEEIKHLQQYLEEKLQHTPYCYGAHGECGKEYKGEAEDWGTEAWEKGIKFLQLGAEFALELVEKRDKLGKSEEYKKDVFFYADRYTHLFLNQISSLLDEPDFDLKEGVFRFAYRIGKKLSNDKMKGIVESTKQKIQSDC